MNLFRNFKYKKNKIFAVGFSSLALVLFFTYYGIQIGFHGFSFFTNDFTEIWNFAIVLFAYFMVFYYNVINDNRAFRGISMFLFMIVASQIINFVFGFGVSIINLLTFDPIIIIFTLVDIAFLVAQIVVGVLLYINARKFMMGRFVDYRKIRKLSILFAAALAVSAISQMVLLGFEGFQSIEFTILYISVFALPLSEVMMAISVVFTFERLY
ncbi:MAG: hypothetical protein SPG64_03555 [Candidatus Enteromonas sp.]|nr:hypothetical protein [Candidatus Enteromonas sp.]